MNILILNGPNLNLLGTRQPEHYGRTTLPQIDTICQEHAAALGIKVQFKQSNHEGVLIDWIHDAIGAVDGIIINAGGYTHTSVALHDALLSVQIPTIELHLSNIKTREAFRHHSYIEPVAFAQIMGHGADGYVMAIDQMLAHLKA